MADTTTNDGAATLQLVTSLSADKAKAEVALAAAQTQVTDLTAQLTAANTKITDLEAKLAGADAGLKLKEAHDQIVSFLSEQTKAAMIAAGETNPTVPTDVAGMLAALSASKLKLHNLPVGGVAEGSARVPPEPDKTAAFAGMPLSAFETRK